MRAALQIMVKDLRLRVRDRSAFMIGIVAPLGLAVILNAVMGDFIDDVSVSYGVVDLDGGGSDAGGDGPVEIFTSVVEGLEQVDVDLTTGLTEHEARQLIDSDKLDAVFVFPAGFASTIESPDPQEGAEIVVLGNRDSTIGTQVASALADGFALNVNAVRLSVDTALDSGSLDADLDLLVEEAASQPTPIQVAPMADADARELDPSTYLIAGMSIFFLFFTVQYGVLGMFEERDQGTLPRLWAAPISRRAVPVAKALGSIVLGLVALTVLVVTSTLVMGADWGDPLAVAVLSVAAVLAAVSMMGVVAALARTAEQAGAIQSIIAFVLAVAGGSFFPVTQGEDWMSVVSVLTPHYWFLRGLGDGLVGGVGDVVIPVAALLAFAVTSSAVGAVAMAMRKAL